MAEVATGKVARVVATATVVAERVVAMVMAAAETAITGATVTAERPGERAAERGRAAETAELRA